MKKLSVYLKSLLPSWDTLKAKGIALLKSKFVTFALKKVLGTAVAGGFRAWLVKYLATELFEEILEPSIDFIIHEVEEKADKISGKFKNKKLNQAIEDQDDEAYDSASDSTFN